DVCAPPADDASLDEAELLAGGAADVADKLAGRSGIATARLVIVDGLSLRHWRQSCHSVPMSANAATRLLQHYVDNFRRLPWRSPPGSPPPDPYRVWLSEVMLQQTTVATVTPRFLRFVERWPTVEALAAAPDTDVLQEWAGLGYYARARNLIACARVVAELGDFPEEEAGLRKLPGIGTYTAAAVAAIAFGKRANPIDTKVERGGARLPGL